MKITVYFCTVRKVPFAKINCSNAFKFISHSLATGYSLNSLQEMTIYSVSGVHPCISILTNCSRREPVLAPINSYPSWVSILLVYFIELKLTFSSLHYSTIHSNDNQDPENQTWCKYKYSQSTTGVEMNKCSVIKLLSKKYFKQN